jgi:hypothetical protein
VRTPCPGHWPLGKVTTITVAANAAVGCSMCDWTARVTAKHLDHGVLRCPVGDCEGELGQMA